MCDRGDMNGGRGLGLDMLMEMRVLAVMGARMSVDGGTRGADAD